MSSFFLSVTCLHDFAFAFVFGSILFGVCLFVLALAVTAVDMVFTSSFFCWTDAGGLRKQLPSSDGGVVSFLG